MSTHFMVFCPLCEVDGPDIRRQAGGTNLNSEDREWCRFLIEHEWHGPLILIHEATVRSAETRMADIRAAVKSLATVL